MSDREASSSQRQFNSASLLVGVVLAVSVFGGIAAAHHNPRLFDNEHGDHGGTYGHGRHIFFWMPDEKRFDFLKVCLWEPRQASQTCKRFEVHRVPAASFRPWGIDIATDRHFEVHKGAWNLRFHHGHNVLSPVLGFHRR